MRQSRTRPDLDHVFTALSNEHRRAILQAVSLHPQAICHLASERGLSFPAIHKHIKILEQAGLILREKIGHTNFLSLNQNSLRSLQVWLAKYDAPKGAIKEALENHAQLLPRKTKGGEQR